MSQSTAVLLTAGPLRLVLTPQLGGSICAFTCSTGGMEWPVFRGCATDPCHILETGSFPLVPFVNRIRDGGFQFRGREIRIEPDLSLDPSPLHGQGWLSSWSVTSATGSEAVLSFSHSAGEWPWAYSARQHFRLDEKGLSLELSCTNEDERPMPCGLGHHPYFPCGPNTRLDTQVESAWTIDELVLPVEKVPAEGRFSLSSRQACAQELDHGFGGWSGRAEISDPDWPFSVAFSSPGTRFFQFYSPAEGDFFVAEPVTHANAALNEPEESWPELGMRVIEPGETMRLDVRFDVISG